MRPDKTRDKANNYRINRLQILLPLGATEHEQKLIKRC